MNFKDKTWWKSLKQMCLMKSVKAVAIFLNFEEFEGREPTKDEFMELWGHGNSIYYYEVRRKYRKGVI